MLSRFSCFPLSATLWTVPRQASLSMGFSGRGHLMMQRACDGHSYMCWRSHFNINQLWHVPYLLWVHFLYKLGTVCPAFQGFVRLESIAHRCENLEQPPKYSRNSINVFVSYNFCCLYKRIMIGSCLFLCKNFYLTKPKANEITARHPKWEQRVRGSLVGCRLWGGTESDTTEAT